MPTIYYIDLEGHWRATYMIPMWRCIDGRLTQSECLYVYSLMLRVLRHLLISTYHISPVENFILIMLNIGIHDISSMEAAVAAVLQAAPLGQGQS